MKPGKKIAAVLFSVALAAVLAQSAIAKDPLRDAFEKFRLLARVFVIVEQQYVKEVDPERLIYGAVNGMLATLDPHTSFLTPELFKNLRVNTTGKFGGLGIEITIQDGVLTVVAPIAGTPADRAGLKSGDRIVELDGQQTKDMTLVEAVNLMRGVKGSSLVLTIVRKGEPEPMRVEIVRDVIRISSVKSELLEPNYGYIRIVSFQEKTTEEILKALADMEKRSGGTLEGLVLDLRNNPGGLLHQAVNTANIFLDEGLIVYTEGRVKSGRMRFSASKSDFTRRYPLVVIVNGGSASASEIVAGALQDHDRALIIGSRSFGKGSVQTIIPLEITEGEETGLRLTTALYYTPKGRSIQALGIKPDILVKPVAPPSISGSPRGLQESDLDRHIKAKKKTKKSERSRLLDDDNQINRAYDLLKSFNIFKKRNGSAESAEKVSTKQPLSGQLPRASRSFSPIDADR